MIYRKATVYLFVFAILVLAFSATISAAEYSRQPRMNLYGSMGDSFTGQASLLYPFNNQVDSLFYTDLRGMFSGDDVSEWNLGFGYRRKIQNRDFILGTYLFHDSRNQLERNWKQWTFGGELLTRDMDFRINFYLPAKDRVLASSLPDDFVKVVGNSLVYEKAQLNTYYEVMGGYDLEFGKRFTDTKGILNNLGAYFRVYNFSGDNTITLSGTGIQIDKLLGDPNDVYYKLGVDWQDDNIRGAITEATFEVSIPFGKGNTQAQQADTVQLENRMTEKARRDIDVIVGETKPERVVEAEEDAQEADTEGTYLPTGKVWYVTANGDGDGSKEDPTNLQALFNSSMLPESKQNIELNRESFDTNLTGEGDIIVLLGNEGNFLLSNPIILKSKQKLLSPGGYLRVYSESDNKRYVDFEPEGKTATLKYENPINQFEIKPQAGFEDMVIIDDNNTVSGIKFLGSQNEYSYRFEQAITGYEVSGNINITNNYFNNLKSAVQIHNIQGETDINIRNNKLDEVAFGITIGNENPFLYGSMTSEFSPTLEVNASSLNAQKALYNIDITISENQITDSIGYGVSVNADTGENYQIKIDKNEIGIKDFRELMLKEDGFAYPIPPFMVGSGISVNVYDALNSSIEIAENTIDHAYQDGILVTSFDNCDSNSINIYDNKIKEVGTAYMDYNFGHRLTRSRIPTEYDYLNNGITVAVLNENIFRVLNSEETNVVNISIENNIIDETYNNGISVINNGMSTNVLINNNKVGLTRNDGINYLELDKVWKPSPVNLQLKPPTYNQIEISNNTIDHALQYGIASYNNNFTEILFEDNSIEQAAQGGIVYFSYPNNENIKLNGNSFGKNVSPKILPYNIQQD